MASPAMVVGEFLAVVARAALQWALASLLLANGAAFCLIAAAASSLRLGPPCLLCARVHRLLCSSSSAAGSCSQEHDALRRLLCDAHAAALAVPAPARSGPEQPTCPASDDHGDRGTSKDDSEKPGGLEAHRVVSIGSEICERDHDDGNQQPPRATDGRNVARTSSIDSSDPYVSLFELAPIVDELPEDNPDGHVHRELDEMPELQDVIRMSGGERMQSVGSLTTALRAQRRELEAVRAELEAERRARAEAVECRRELEEQGEFDREAVRLAMQLVHEAETEKYGLQRQLDASKVKSQLYEAAMDATSLPLGVQPSRRAGEGDGDETKEVEDSSGAGGREDSWNNNYQSLMDFMPGSVYSSSPDLANLLKLYTGGNGAAARRPSDSDKLTDASAVAVVTEEEEEVVAVAVAAVSGSNGANSEITTRIASASLPESGSDYIEAASS